MLQWITTYPGIHGQHKLDQMGVNNKIWAQIWLGIEEGVDLGRAGGVDEYNQTKNIKFSKI